MSALNTQEKKIQRVNHSVYTFSVLPARDTVAMAMAPGHVTPSRGEEGDPETERWLSYFGEKI
jgi:hypothetical protein